MLLKGKTAVVTGGSRGIGLAIVKRFLEEGANVALCGSREETTKKAVDAILADDANTQTQWYTVGGVLLPAKPTDCGVYLCRKFDKNTQTVITRKVVINK